MKNVHFWVHFIDTMAPIWTFRTEIQNEALVNMK